MMRLTLLLSLALVPVSATAAGISLQWPVACDYGKDCFIQNYVDQDSTAAWRDFRCGALSYNGHKGTDIRLKNEAVMHAGVAVLAAADGTVRAVRDGVEDVNVKTIGAEAVKHRECGNGVVIHHAMGFETQYCHLQRGSIAVQQGQKVTAGTMLGRIGMSGATEFPHLHFEVRRLGRTLDPFTAQPAGGRCKEAQPSSLWAATPDYISTALLGHGFSPAPPKAETVRAQASGPTRISRTSPALVYWADIMGVQAGDVLTLSLLSSNGQVAATRDIPFTRPLAQSFSFVGRKALPEGLPPGTYKASLKLIRKGQDTPVLSEESSVEVPY